MYEIGTNKEKYRMFRENVINRSFIQRAGTMRKF